MKYFFQRQDLRGGLRLKQILPAAAWYFTIVCVRFFRAERGKTEHQRKLRYRSAEGKNADRVTPANV